MTIHLTFIDWSDEDVLPIEVRTRQEAQEAERKSTIDRAIDLTAREDRPFSMGEVLQVLKRLGKSAPGEDGISYALLKQLPQPVLMRILGVLNRSWQDGKLPQVWKRATIVSMPKPGREEQYRPISLLPFLSKVMERLVQTRIRESISEDHPNLFGFRKGVGIGDAVGYVTALISDRAHAPGSKRSFTLFIDLEKVYIS